LFVNDFSGKIASAVANALQNAINQNIEVKANGVLAQLPVEEPIGNTGVEIDFELISNPTFASNYLSLPELGEFYIIAQHQECPDPRPTIPDVVTNQMVQMIVSEFVANSAGFAFLKDGQLQVSITDSDIPSWAPIRLNTSDWKTLVPNLYKVFPNLMMVLHLDETEEGNAVFSSDGLLINAYGDIGVMVVEENGTQVEAFTLSGTMTTSGIAILTGQVISGNLTFLRANFSLAHSNIGFFDVTILDDLINLLLSDGVVPAVNARLKKGFTLPTVPGLDFVNPSIGYGDKYIYVTTDITYTPDLFVPNGKSNDIKII